jgi:hypothetical protein
MASILYIASENGLERRFRAFLEMAVPHKKFEICHSVGELSAKLIMPLSNVKAAIFFALTWEEMTGILSLRDLMADVKSILILADDDRETIMKAHTLRPYYVTCVDTDFSLIGDVLRNMVDLYDVPESLGSAEFRVSSSAMG